LEIAKNISATVLKAFIFRRCHSGPALRLCNPCSCIGPSASEGVMVFG